MNYQIEIKEYAPIKVVSIRYQGAYSDIGKYIGTLYKVAKNHAKGAPFNCYYDEGAKDIADVEVCVPVTGDINSSEVTVKTLPSIKAISTTHIGTYDTLHFAYTALTAYAKENDLELEAPSREIYVKGPGMIFKGNPEKYITEIAIPIKQ